MKNTYGTIAAFLLLATINLQGNTQGQTQQQPNSSIMQQITLYFDRIFGTSGSVRDALRGYTSSETPALSAQQKNDFAALPLQEKLYVLNEWAARQTPPQNQDDSDLAETLQDEIQPLLPKKVNISYNAETNQFELTTKKYAK